MSSRARPDARQVILLENDLLRIELLPDFGAKIYSIHYKPTDREILWHNPSNPPRRPELAQGAVIDAEVTMQIRENKPEAIHMTIKAWRAIAVISTLALAFLALTSYFHLWIRRPASPATIITEIHKLNQLVTVRYSIQRVVGIKESKVPVGEESILLMVQGEVLAGIDLDRIRNGDIEYAGNRSIVIALPPARLLNSFLDESQTKVWDRHITWWTPWIPYDPDLEHKARLQAINDVRDAAIKMGILEQADKNAKVSIRGLLNAFNLQVSFKTRALD